jgi:hypothetical protein
MCERYKEREKKLKIQRAIVVEDRPWGMPCHVKYLKKSFYKSGNLVNIFILLFLN